MYFASFAVVILLAFFFTKYLGIKSNSLSKGQNTKVIEAISLGNNTRILIIEIFEVIYIVYDNNSHVLLLDKLNKKDINIEARELKSDMEHIYSIAEKTIMQKDNIVRKFIKRKNR
ncbi:flagellar biosynthetic protein FliO [Proteiniborus sp. DW1]|uniref:flagellar biosynthetic protein FliO n=1 Tax=Proteiniborus sp. DW1 TaxID=1889883 RepID=UPI001FA920C9|nr:flagellar biosynthetic protein FliO [Proteiniborus sp. DW1]